MKKFSFLLLILLGVNHLAQAQTKKIALYSHSGSNATFDLAFPDEFGCCLTPIRTEKENPALKADLKKKKWDKQQQKKATKLDQTAVCKRPDSLMQSPPSPAPKTKLTKAKTSKATKKKAAKTMADTPSTKVDPLPPTPQPEEKKATTKATKLSPNPQAPNSLGLTWLGLLLGIPALVSVVVLFKR